MGDKCLQIRYQQDDHLWNQHIFYLAPLAAKRLAFLYDLQHNLEYNAKFLEQNFWNIAPKYPRQTKPS